MKQNNKNRSNGRYGRFNNNRRFSNNFITRNTVFDSSSVAGRLRGTSQQLIEKYLSLAKDSKHIDDKVLAETYLQYADHYTRLLEVAMTNEQPKNPPQQVEIEVSNEPETCSVPEEKDVPGPEAAAEPERTEAVAQAEVQEKQDAKEVHRKPRRRVKTEPATPLPTDCAPTVEPTVEQEK